MLGSKAVLEAMKKSLRDKFLFVWIVLVFLLVLEHDDVALLVDTASGLDNPVRFL